MPTFGEGLIIATNKFAGIELMKYRLKTNNVVILPENNRSAVEFLLLINFTQFKPMKRMWLGEKTIWQPEKLYNRIGSAIS